MADQTTVQQLWREQVTAANTASQNVFDAWTDLAQRTTTYTFDLAAQSLRFSQTVRADTERMIEDTLTINRTLYQDALKQWQDYLHRVAASGRSA